MSQSKLGFDIGKGIQLKPPEEILFVTTVIMAQRASEATEILAEKSINCGIFHMHSIKPFDHDGLIQAAESAKLIISIEEHVLNGGLGSAVLESFSDHGLNKKVIRLGIPDVFADKYGSQDIIMAGFGLDPDSIAKTVIKHIT